MVRSRATTRGWLKGAWALLAVVSLLVATLSAGHRYFACGKMHRTAFAACCSHHADGGESSVDADACCHARELASPDQGFASAPRGVMTAPLVAILTVPALQASATSLARAAEPWWARAGPYESPGDHRIRLRVSLT